MAIAQRKDPFRGFNFRVEIDTIGVAGFRECGGLSFTTDAVEYREGNDGALHPRKLMGMRKFGNISLKSGYTDSRELWNWYKDILGGKPTRHNGAVILMDEQGGDVVRWEFLNGWICKYEGPAMNATNNEVAIEMIEICVEQVVIA